MALQLQLLHAALERQSLELQQRLIAEASTMRTAGALAGGMAAGAAAPGYTGYAPASPLHQQQLMQAPSPYVGGAAQGSPGLLAGSIGMSQGAYSPAPVATVAMYGGQGMYTQGVHGHPGAAAGQQTLMVLSPRTWQMEPAPQSTSAASPAVAMAIALPSRPTTPPATTGGGSGGGVYSVMSAGAGHTRSVSMTAVGAVPQSPGSAGVARYPAPVSD